MEPSILIAMSLAMVLFIWTWIGLTIVQRLDLERKIEKLNHIENRLPEEERTISHLKELRAIEQNKVGSAKLILGLFGVLIAGAIATAAFYEPAIKLFGFDHLITFESLAISVLAFLVIPTYVGLTLAGTTTKEAKDKKAAEGAA
jgi:hypothetical protein